MVRSEPVRLTLPPSQTSRISLFVKLKAAQLASLTGGEQGHITAYVSFMDCSHLLIKRVRSCD